VDALNSVLAVLVAVTIVASMRVVGILLVAALMVLPVASGQLLGRSQRATMGWSVLIGLVSVVVGLSAAYWWGLAPGGAIVLVAVAAFALVATGDGLLRSPVLRRRPRTDPSPAEPVGAGRPGRDDDRAAISSPGSVLTDSQSGW
jgi:zinc transport system permease protein